MARRETFMGNASTPVGGSSTTLRQLGHLSGSRSGRQMEYVVQAGLTEGVGAGQDPRISKEGIAHRTCQVLL